MVHHVFCGGSTFQVILKVHWAIWEDPIGVWVWEIWGACMAVSAFGELLESVLILNWRSTVERCLDRFCSREDGMRNVQWLVWLSCKKFWKAAVVLERFKEYSNDPGQNCGSVLAFFFEVARAILQCFLRTHPTVYLFFCFRY